MWLVIILIIIVIYCVYSSDKNQKCSSSDSHVTDSAKAISAQYDKKISEIRAKSYGSNRGQFYNDLNNANEQIISYMNYLVNRPYSKSVEAAYHILWQCAEKHSQIYGSGGNVQYPQYRGMLMEDIVSEIKRHTKV